jgi:hypothetical protein
VPKPSALALAKRQLTDATVADVKRGQNGALVVSQVIESPAPVRPGRYALLTPDELRLLITRITAAESSAQLTRLARKQRSGR